MDRNEYIMMQLDDIIGVAKQAREKVLQHITDANQFIYAMQWAENVTYDNAMGQIAENLRAWIDAGNAVEDVLKMAQSELTRQLLCDQFRGASTSQFRNATEHQQRAATSRMLEKVEGWVVTMREEA